jgi:hypothetical protein
MGEGENGQASQSSVSAMQIHTKGSLRFEFALVEDDGTQQVQIKDFMGLQRNHCFS